MEAGSVVLNPIEDRGSKICRLSGVEENLAECQFQVGSAQ
jgi:hypothetical protein